MNNEELRRNIALKIEDLHTLIAEIKLLDMAIESSEPGSLKHEYLDNLHDIIIDYQKICNKLKQDLNLYFEKEKKKEVPIDFTYHKLMKALEESKV